MGDRAERLAQLRAAANLGDFRTACASDWDTVDSDDVDGATQIPVLDFVSGEPIAKDDLVVLSDGKCYSKSSMRLVVEQSPRRLDGAIMLATQMPMQPEDFALLGIDAPVPMPLDDDDAARLQERVRLANQRIENSYLEWKRGNLQAIDGVAQGAGFPQRIAREPANEWRALWHRYLQEMGDNVRVQLPRFANPTIQYEMGRQYMQRHLNQAVPDDDIEFLAEQFESWLPSIGKVCKEQPEYFADNCDGALADALNNFVPRALRQREDVSLGILTAAIYALSYSENLSPMRVYEVLRAKQQAQEIVGENAAKLIESLVPMSQLQSELLTALNNCTEHTTCTRTVANLLDNYPEAYATTLQGPETQYVREILLDFTIQRLQPFRQRLGVQAIQRVLLQNIEQIAGFNAARELMPVIQSL